MLEGLIRRSRRNIQMLNEMAENDELTPKEAESVREKLEQEHHLLDMLTGDKGDRRPSET